MMTVMMTVVSVAYWRWNSRVTEKNVSFRSEVFTLARQPELKEEDIPVLHQLNEEYSRVARLVERVLVSIDTTGVTSVPQPSEDGDFMIEKRLTVHGLGSGVIVTEEGHIITAYHVIQNKHALRVTLSNGKSVSVRLVGVDPELDIAVLQVENPMTFTPLPFGNSDEIAPGMIVLACGNPYGLGTTVSRGIISARERKLVDSGINLIQTDASIFPGNSGGPLINIRGEIIGINKSVLPNAEKNYAGIGFAIPSNLVMHSFEQICKHGRPMKGYLGLDIVRNTPPLRSFLDYHEAGGAVINIVKHGSPAEQAGLQTGDVILSFNEVPIQTDEEVKERIENLSIGDKFWLKVWRKGQEMNVTLKVGDSIRTFKVGARHVAVADDKTHMITVYSDGKVIRRVPTSMGKAGHETPNGFYYIGDKHRHIVMDSSTYGVPVTAPEGYRTDVEYALRMTYSGIFLHAAPWSVGAQGSYDSSHGCLNVSTENGKWLFENWRRGDVVRVINSKGTLSKYDGMGDWAPGAY